MEIKPLTDRVVIKPKAPEEKTAGGIYIPESAQEKTKEGSVIAVGEGKEGPLPVKIGDVVVYDSFGGTEITINDEKHIIMSIKDVLAIVR